MCKTEKDFVFLGFFLFIDSIQELWTLIFFERGAVKIYNLEVLGWLLDCNETMDCDKWFKSVELRCKLMLEFILGFSGLKLVDILLELS